MKKLLLFGFVLVLFSGCNGGYMLEAPNKKVYFIDYTSCNKFVLKGDVLMCYDLDKNIQKEYHPLGGGE